MFPAAAAAAAALLVCGLTAASMQLPPAGGPGAAWSPPGSMSAVGGPADGRTQPARAAVLCARGYDIVALLEHGATEAVGLELAPTAVRRACVSLRAKLCVSCCVLRVSTSACHCCHWQPCCASKQRETAQRPSAALPWCRSEWPMSISQAGGWTRRGGG